VSVGAGIRHGEATAAQRLRPVTMEEPAWNWNIHVQNVSEMEPDDKADVRLTLRNL
jgi:hypothetical protein